LRVVLAAEYKAGKTTVMGNLIRSLADGDPFLGRDAVHPTNGCVVLLDFEMNPAHLDAWLRSQHIQHDDRVRVLPMRGRAGDFDILNPVTRAAWAEQLRECHASYLIWDCFRPLLGDLQRVRFKAGVEIAVDRLKHETIIVPEHTFGTKTATECACDLRVSERRADKGVLKIRQAESWWNRRGAHRAPPPPDRDGVATITARTLSVRTTRGRSRRASRGTESAEAKTSKCRSGGRSPRSYREISDWLNGVRARSASPD
jgi:hypothetical protein